MEFGERLEEAIVREFDEEHGMEIVIERLLCVADHILPEEGQHWVSPTYIGRHVGGEPLIREPGKCAALGWFDMDDLPEPLSLVTQSDVRAYREQQG